MVNYQFNVQNCVLHYTIGKLSKFSQKLLALTFIN